MFTLTKAPVRRLLGSVILMVLMIPAAPALAHDADDVVFDGSGWGHGVGMSQYGAYGMALNGHSPESILAHYYQGTVVADVSETTAADFIFEQDQPLWVGLLQNQTVFEFSLAGGGATLCQGWGSESDCSLTAEAGETWAYRTDVNDLCVFERLEPAGLVGEARDCDGSIRPEAETTVTSLDEGYDYSSGIFRLRAVDGDPQSFHVVLQIGIDPYLGGIAEMPTSWEMAALKAQVIAARSYLIANVSAKGPQSEFSDSTKEKCWCHLYDDTRSQVYKGDILLDSESWQTAVSETVRQVVSYDGTLVRAFYSSSSGGWTENSEDVWVTARPWLVSVDDSWAHLPEVDNPLSSWTRRWDREAAADALGFDVLHSAKVYKRPSGGVSSVEFTGEIGGDIVTVTIKGTSARSLFKLPSHYFSITMTDTLDVTAYDIAEDVEAPVGWFEEASDGVESVRVRGWIMDPDTPLPIYAHIYVDGGFAAGLLAELPRADVEKAFDNGKYHGLDVTFALEPGTHTVCLYAINAPTKTNNPRIGCKTVTITSENPEPDSEPDSDPNVDAHVPFGWVDEVAIADGQLVLRGWTIDEDNPDQAVNIHVYVDGSFMFGGPADTRRVDVDKAFGLGEYHGFYYTKPIDPGTHTVCIYAINQPSKTNNTKLGCETVD